MTDPIQVPSSFRLATHAVVYGGVSGVLGGLWTWLQFELGVYGQHSGMVTVLITVGAIAFGIIRWRDRVMGGRMGFIHAFGTGLAIGLVAAALVGGVARIHAALDASLLDEILSVRETGLLKAGFTPEEIAADEEMMRSRFTPGGYGLTMFTVMLMVSLISSLLGAIVVRKKLTR